MPTLARSWVAALCLVLAASGRAGADERKSGDPDAKGERDDGILVRTPIGGLEVSSAATPEEIGLAVYPGARRVDEKRRHSRDGESGSLQFGIWGAGTGLRLTLLKYRSDDGVAAVAAFYRKELSRYGTVVECRDGERTPAADAKADASSDDGDDDEERDSCDDDGARPGAVQLSVGKKRDRHIVSVKPKGDGVELVLLRLRLRESRH